MQTCLTYQIGHQVFRFAGSEQRFRSNKCNLLIIPPKKEKCEGKFWNFNFLKKKISRSFKSYQKTLRGLIPMLSECNMINGSDISVHNMLRILLLLFHDYFLPKKNFASILFCLTFFCLTFFCHNFCPPQ